MPAVALDLSRPVSTSALAATIDLLDIHMRAGLSWSAEGHLVQRCDQVDLLSNHPQAMHDMVVLTNADHEFTCKTLFQRNGRVRQVPANPAYPDIRPKEGQTIEVWDLATAALTLLRN